MNYQRILIAYFIFLMIGFLIFMPNSIVYGDNSKDLKQFTFDCPPEKITAYYAKMKDFDKFWKRSIPCTIRTTFNKNRWKFIFSFVAMRG